MPIDLFMTWDRLLLTFLGVCTLILFFGRGFVNDLNNETNVEYATPTNTQSDDEVNRPILDGYYPHVHWFVQVWYGIELS